MTSMTAVPISIIHLVRYRPYKGLTHSIHFSFKANNFFQLDIVLIKD